MKILFDYKIFYQQKVGGISNYFYNLGKQLIKLNQDILYSIPLHKNIYLIHTLTIYYSGKQKYGKNYFTNLKGILKFYNLKYIEYGEKWNNEEGRTFFLAKI